MIAMWLWWLGTACADERQILDLSVGLDRGGTPDFAYGRVHGVSPLFGFGWRGQSFGASETRIWKSEFELSMAVGALGGAWFEGEKVELFEDSPYSLLKLDFAARWSVGRFRVGDVLIKPNVGLGLALPARLYEVEGPGLSWNFAAYGDTYGVQVGAIAEVRGWQLGARGDLHIGPLLGSAAPPGSFGRYQGSDVLGGADNLSGPQRFTRYTLRAERTYGGLAPWATMSWESLRIGVGERPGIVGPLRGRGLTATLGVTIRQKVEERDQVGGGRIGDIEVAQKAARAGNVDRLRAMLDAGFAPDTAHPLEGTALAAAAAAGQVDAMTLLLERGASVEASAPVNGATPLMAAAGANQVEALDLLLARGALVDRRDTNGAMTALMWACQMGAPEAVDRLLRAGADRTLTSTVTASGGGFDCAAWNQRGFGTSEAKQAIAARLAQP